jgi:hypothetical protein
MSTVIGANYSVTLSAADRANSGKGFGLGDLSTDQDGNVWLYCQASAAVAANYFVVISPTYTVAPITTTNGLLGLRVGSPSAAMASGDYGFVQVFGPSTVQVLASAAANTRLNTTATAGALDDDGTATTKEIRGVALTTARAASNGTAPAILNWPVVSTTL